MFLLILFAVTGVRLVLHFHLEGLVAALADVRICLLVNGRHVLLQMRQLRKRCSRVHAQETLEGFLSRVLANVQLQHARMGERLPTDLATVGPIEIELKN